MLTSRMHSVIGGRELPPSAAGELQGHRLVAGASLAPLTGRGAILRHRVVAATAARWHRSPVGAGSPGSPASACPRLHRSAGDFFGTAIARCNARTRASSNGTRQAAGSSPAASADAHGRFHHPRGAGAPSVHRQQPGAPA